MVMDSYLQSLLAEATAHEPDDEIVNCGCDLELLPGKPDELLKLADQKIHVFPFKEVKSCWFRLYTDASIVKAIHLLHPPNHADQGGQQPGDISTRIDQAVSVLDMALIMGGGLGREGLLHRLLDRIGDMLGHEVESVPPPKKKQKLETSDHTEDRSLPSDIIMLPQLSHPLPSLTAPPLEDFQRHMRDRRGPVVLNGILDHWPAVESWKKISFWNAVTLGGRRLVPVELGRSYVDDEWGQKIMPFRQFLDNHILGDKSETRTGYLAQHDLLKQLPRLHAGISTPDYCYLDAPPPEPNTPVALALANAKSQKTSHPTTLPVDARALEQNSEEAPDVQSNVWFGPAWTISPLHHDPYHNILCQVVGKKYVRLYSPHDSSRLYPRRRDEPAPHLVDGEKHATIDMSNTSQIDVAAMELSPHEDWDDVYPGISQVPFFECILEAGQALYIPIGWWHYIRSCSVGISVSFWW